MKLTQSETKREKTEEEKAAWKSNEHGLPNWRHVDRYHEYWGALTPDSKRWEFLRRNQDYRRAWKNFIEGTTTLPSQKIKQPKFLQKMPRKILRIEIAKNVLPV